MNLHKKASGLFTIAIGCFILGSLFLMIHWVEEASTKAEQELTLLTRLRDGAILSRDANRELMNLKRIDVQKFKDSLENEATAKKSLFEAGVMLHDEKRLLDKQWDIMSTTVLIDGDGKKVTLLKDDVPVDTFLLSGAPVIYGSTQTLRVGTTLRITAKERYAHPERGKAESVNGVLQWTPPQVGTSVRANALGEYVIFTDSPLILHGPPTKAADHAAYSHICINLSLDAAKKLYQKSFIGTKITLIQTLPAQPAAQSSAE